MCHCFLDDGENYNIMEVGQQKNRKHKWKEFNDAKLAGEGQGPSLSASSGPVCGARASVTVVHSPMEMVYGMGGTVA